MCVCVCVCVGARTRMSMREKTKERERRRKGRGSWNIKRMRREELGRAAVVSAMARLGSSGDQGAPRLRNRWGQRPAGLGLRGRKTRKLRGRNWAASELEGIGEGE